MGIAHVISGQSTARNRYTLPTGIMLKPVADNNPVFEKPARYEE
jgi:hypothetical protein